MKISTIRSLLILLDFLLMAGIAGIVQLGFAEDKTRKEERRDYFEGVKQRLRQAKPGTVDKWSPSRGESIDAANLHNKPKEVPKPVTDVKPKDPAKKVARALDTLVKLIGTEVHPGGGSGEPSFVLYRRLDESPLAAGNASSASSAPPATSRPGRGAPRGGNRNARRTSTPAVPAGPRTRFYAARENEVIEFSGHEVALVKQVSEGSVLFEYDSKDVTLRVSTERGLPSTGPSGGGAKPVPSGPISPDPGTWIAWGSDKPNVINITPMGMRAFDQKGESALEGVRWATERLQDGKEAVKVTRIPKDSAMVRGGAQSGDIIVSINGVRVSSKASIVAYVKANPNLPAYTVKFLRKGRVYTRVIRPPKGTTGGS